MSKSADNPEVCIELFKKIYNETFISMRKYVAARCSDTAYIADILQDVYLEYYKLLVQKGAGYAADNQAILYSIAKRRIFHYYSLKDRLKILVPLYKSNASGDEYEEIVSYDAVFEDDVIDSIESERLWKIINTYTADIRKIFYLFFSEDMTLSQIAKAMNYSLSCVKQKLYRTLKDIRRKEHKS